MSAGPIKPELVRCDRCDINGTDFINNWNRAICTECAYSLCERCVDKDAEFETIAGVHICRLCQDTGDIV